jgi:two-component system, NtrC family, response regulator HydG
MIEFFENISPEIKMILDTLQSGINITDKTGKILFVNKTYCKMHGYSEDELLGYSISKILPNKDQTTSLKNFRKIINKKIKKSFVVKSSNRRKDGSLFPVVLSWNYLMKDEKLIGMITTVQDITEMTENQVELEKSKEEIKQLQSRLEKREYLEYMMGDSKKIREIHDFMEKVAATDFSVLIIGETGTGKEIIAQSIHKFSRREKQPIISIDCGAITESLIESELFGYVKGAFTGAYETRSGVFQNANGGTVFLDEIGNLSAEMQKKLLRVLQEKEVSKVGSVRKEKLDVRIIAAANETFPGKVNKGDFRKDLFYRLNEFHLKLPALKERKEDIPLLVHRFIRELCMQLKVDTKKISSAALNKLNEYSWPGNVRELKNIIKRAIIVSEEEIHPEHLSLAGFEDISNSVSASGVLQIYLDDNFDYKKTVKQYTESVERKIIQKAIEKFNGNKSKTAKFLNIDYKTILKKAKL